LAYHWNSRDNWAKPQGFRYNFELPLLSWIYMGVGALLELCESCEIIYSKMFSLDSPNTKIKAGKWKVKQQTSNSNSLSLQMQQN